MPDMNSDFDIRWPVGLRLISRRPRRIVYLPNTVAGKEGDNLLGRQVDHDATTIVIRHEVGHDFFGEPAKNTRDMHATLDRLLLYFRLGDERTTSRLAALKAALDRQENTPKHDEEMETIVGLLADRFMQPGSGRAFVCNFCYQQRQRFELPLI